MNPADSFPVFASIITATKRGVLEAMNFTRKYPVLNVEPASFRLWLITQSGFEIARKNQILHHRKPNQ